MLDHAERHDAGAGRRVGRDQEAVELIVFHRKVEAQQRGADIARLTDLQRDVGFLDDHREVLVRHGDRPAIDVERDVGTHIHQMLADDR